MGTHAADGSLNITVTDGSTITGLHAPDGSINVVLANGSVPVGAYHPSGAWWVTLAPSDLHSIRAPDGSLYVSEAPYDFVGQKVTVVSGDLTPGPGSGAAWNWFWW